MKRDLDRAVECAAEARAQLVVNEARQELGGGQLAGEARIVIEIAVAERAADLVEDAKGEADVDDDVMRIELAAAKLGIDDVCRAVLLRSRSENCIEN